MARPRSKVLYKKDYTLTKALSLYLNTKDQVAGEYRSQMLVMKLFALALSGDMNAIKMIWDRIEGVPGSAEDDKDAAIEAAHKGVSIQILDLSSNQSLQARFPALTAPQRTLGNSQLSLVKPAPEDELEPSEPAA